MDNFVVSSTQCCHPFLIDVSSRVAIVAIPTHHTSVPQQHRSSPQVVQQESNQYSDPITQFLECLLVQYDFEGAQQKLKLCEQVFG